MIVVAALGCWCANKKEIKELMAPLDAEPVDLDKLKDVDMRWKYDMSKLGGRKLKFKSKANKQPSVN